MRLLALFLAFSISLAAQVVHYDNLLIEKLDIQVMHAPGNTNVESIRSRLKTHQGDLFSQNNFDADLKVLTQDFDRVEPVLETAQSKLFLTLRLWPKATIRTITWNGNCKLYSDTLQKELDIACGTVFDRDAFGKAFNKVKAYYVKEGFFEAALCYDATLDTLCNEVDITVSVNEGRSGRIKAILFHGFTKEEECELLGELVTKKWNIFTSWLSNEGTYQEEAMQHDELTVLNYLQNKGYADAKVSLEVCEAGSSNRIFIHISTERGTCYTVSSVTFNGQCLFTEEQLRERLEFTERSPYGPELIRDSIESIQNLYGRYGYIDTIVDYEPKLEADCPAYAIHFTIEEGEQFRVGLIKVLGNHCTETKVLLHETLLVPGEIFNTERLQLTETRLKNIGYFSCVNVYAVKSDSLQLNDGCNYRDVYIEVEETTTGQFGVSLGVSSQDKLFGGVNVTEKNFNYRGLPQLFTKGFRAIKGGGEYARLGTTIGQNRNCYNLSWTQPYFYDTPWSVGFDIDRINDRSKSEYYTINSWGILLRAHYQVNAFVRFGLHYRFRDSKFRAHRNHQNQSTREQESNSGIISGVGSSLTYDNRDAPVRTTCGLFSKGITEYVGVGGKHHYGILSYLNTFYHPVTTNSVMKYHADVKLIFPFGGQDAKDIPVDERFFLGGDDLRGYRPFSIGPRFDTSEPSGGITSLLLSSEYNYRMTDRLDLFAFIDGGSITGKTISLRMHQGRNSSMLKMAAGYGVRFNIAECGPAIAVGFGYPLNAFDKSIVKRFFFTLGGQF